MEKAKTYQLANFIDTKNLRSVISYAKKYYFIHYKKRSFKTIDKCFRRITDLFNGKFPGYKACNTRYHNLQHTYEVFIAAAVLYDGFSLNEYELPEQIACNLLVAALFHDTGYIQEEWDHEGTGAKHSEGHVGRSISFLVRHHDTFGLNKEDVSVISNIIRCTDLGVNLDAIPFCSKEECLAGWMLGSADIMGQMSDREYLERLLFLYYEFREAGVPGYNTEFDIIRNTLNYYETVTKKLCDNFGNTYNYARYHFKERAGIDQNLYMDAIERNIAYIEKIIEDDTTNFRHKLKRGDQKEIHSSGREFVKQA